MDIEIEKLNTKLSALRGEFSFISKEELTYNEGEFICPTCKRPLEIEDIEAKQREMQANYNANKAARLKEKKEAGMAKKQRLEEMQGLKDRTNAEIEELNTLTKQRKREVDQAKILIGNYKEQQNNVRNNREFDAITKEIEYQELEIELAEKGRGGRIILKMNALQDPIMIDRLYEASQRGVKIDLIVRGICCLIPGQEYSRNIRVTRIVDSFLEHARIWYFGNAGHPKVYLGSPDWMRRNLYRRIEAVVPVLDSELREEIVDMLHIQLSDNQKACFVDEKLNNIFKFKASAAPVRAQYTFYNYLKEKNETFL